jgi:hypothetical protein
MSKTAATALARKRLAGGHFRVDYADAKVRCPRCEHHDILMYATMGRLPHGDMVKQLAQGIRDCELNESYA